MESICLRVINVNVIAKSTEAPERETNIANGPRINRLSCPTPLILNGSGELVVSNSS